MKTADALLNEFLSHVRPPRGCAITLLEHKSSGPTDPNWDVSASNKRPMFAFVGERHIIFTDALNRIVKRLGERTTIGFPVHFHMLRHACGFALANSGHDTRSIQ